jgi:hypothetical protein
MTTLLVVSWTIASGTGALQRSGTHLMERITVLTYPAADIVLLAVLITVFGRGRRSLTDPLLVVGACFFMLLLGDSLSIYISLAGSYQTGSPIAVCWVAAFLLLGLAALVPSLPSDEVTRGSNPLTWPWRAWTWTTSRASTARSGTMSATSFSARWAGACRRPCARGTRSHG